MKAPQQPEINNSLVALTDWYIAPVEEMSTCIHIVVDNIRKTGTAASHCNPKKTNINSFETQWKAAVSDAVSAKLASPAPKVSNASQTGLSKADFAKMTIAQQTEIYKTNPELYKQLTAR